MNNIEDRLTTMKREIDALQVAMLQSAKPWYHSIATWVSICALVFSFGTTYVSYKRTYSNDIAGTRQELRSLLQRLTILPQENVRAMKEFSSDPQTRAIIMGLINQENGFVVRNAVELARKLPPNSVSAAEYQALALALQNSYDVAGAIEFLDYSLDANPNFNTEVTAIRSMASLRYLQGARQAGIELYRKALDIFSKYPQYDSFTKAATQVRTELAWAFSEANAGFFDEANKHIANARNYVSGMPNAEGVNSLRAEIDQLKLNIETAVKSGSSGPSAVSGVGSSLATSPSVP